MYLIFFIFFLLSQFTESLAVDCLEGCCFDSYRVHGSWLYWKQDGDEYQYAVVKDIGSAPPTRHIDRERIHNIKFSWNEGFRLGVGKEDCCLGFDLDLIWSHFHSGSTSAIKVIGQEPVGFGIVKAVALPSFALLSTIVLEGEEVQVTGRDRIKYDVIDFEVGQSFNFNDQLHIRPFLGIRVADLKESFKNKLETFSPLVLGVFDIFVHHRTKFKGVGVLAGLDLNYFLCDGWSLMGRAAGSILQGYNHLKNHARFNTGTTIDAFDETIKEHYRQLKPIVDLAIGLKYNSCLCGYFPVTFALIWEEHLIFRQLRYRVNDNLIDGLAIPTATWTKTGTTTLQGFTLSACVDF